jgi:LmbE family N-acetylglucosaminyl deacetylase
MNILVCASHADDEVLGAGGTIAKLSAIGHTVYCWFYFSGINCNGVQQEQPKTVSDILGTVWPPFVMPMTVDNESDMVPLLDIARSIEDAIDKTQPEIVYIPSVHDLNIDHRHVAEAALVAIRPIHEATIRRVLSYGVPSVTAQAFGQFGAFKPTVFEELSGTDLDKKLDAIELYRYLMSDAVFKSTIATCEYHGSWFDLPDVEAFELIWERR